MHLVSGLPGDATAVACGGRMAQSCVPAACAQRAASLSSPPLPAGPGPVQDTVDTIQQLCIGQSAHQKLDLLQRLLMLLGFDSLAVFGDCFDEVRGTAWSAPAAAAERCHTLPPASFFPACCPPRLSSRHCAKPGGQGGLTHTWRRLGRPQVTLLDPVRYPEAIRAFAREVCRNDLLSFGRLHLFFPDSRCARGGCSCSSSAAVARQQHALPCLAGASSLAPLLLQLRRGEAPRLLLLCIMPWRACRLALDLSTDRTLKEARFDRHFVRDLTWSRHQVSGGACTEVWAHDGSVR